MRGRVGWTGLLAAVAVSCVLVAGGCGDAESGEEGVQVTGSGSGTGEDSSPAVDVTYDEALSVSLRELSSKRRTARLSALTDFDWDTVYVFGEGVSATDVHDAVGEPVLSAERYYDAGNLLIFVRAGTVERAVSVLPDLLSTGSTQEFGRSVRLEPFGAGTPSLLRLTDG